MIPMHFSFVLALLIVLGFTVSKPSEAGKRITGHLGSEFKGFNPCGWNTCRSPRSTRWRRSQKRVLQPVGARKNITAPMPMPLKQTTEIDSSHEISSGLAIFKTNCLGCHAQPKGQLPAYKNWKREQWELAVDAIESGNMPKNNPGSIKGKEFNQLVAFFNSQILKTAGK